MCQSIKQIVNIGELAAIAQRPLLKTNSFLIAENTTIITTISLSAMNSVTAPRGNNMSDYGV